MISNYLTLIVGAFLCLHLSLATAASVHLPIEGSKLERDVANILMVAPKRTVYLGTVGSKAYFMDNSTTRTWDEQKGNATVLNLKLAEISNSEEADFIKNLSTYTLPFNAYWLGGQVSDAEYRWDHSGDAVEEYSLNFTKPISRSCVYLTTTPSGSERYMATSPCHAQIYVILQTY